jgi:hypothetical protein
VLVVLRHLDARPRRQRLSLEHVARLEAEQLAEHVADPRGVHRRIGGIFAGLVEPLLVGQAQASLQLGRDLLQPLGEHAQERGRAEERARDVHQAEPLEVVGGHRGRAGEAAAHAHEAPPRCEGTTYVIETGKTRSSEPS